MLFPKDLLLVVLLLLLPPPKHMLAMLQCGRLLPMLQCGRLLPMLQCGRLLPMLQRGRLLPMLQCGRLRAHAHTDVSTQGGRNIGGDVWMPTVVGETYISRHVHCRQTGKCTAHSFPRARASAEACSLVDGTLEGLEHRGLGIPNGSMVFHTLAVCLGNARMGCGCAPC